MRVVDDRVDAIAQRDHVGARDDLVGEFRFARLPEHDARRARVVDAELGLEAGARRRLAGELEHERMHAQVDARDVVRAQPVRVAQLHAAVDGRMDHDAAGERLVRVERDLEALAELVGDLVPRALRRVGLRDPARRLDRLRGRREAVLRHQRRRQARARRGARMERLGHRAELLAHADRLRRRDAERHRRAVGVERSSRAQAAAAPSMPVEPVMCQPRS